MKIEYATTANRPPEQVWDMFVQTEQWPQWSGLIERVSWVEGPPWQPGSKIQIEVKQPQFKLRATASEVSAPHRFVSTASVMGVAIEQHFEFAALPEGKTLIKSWINLSGPAVFFINDEKKKTGLELFSHWVEKLRAAVETQA